MSREHKEKLIQLLVYAMECLTLVGVGMVIVMKDKFNITLVVLMIVVVVISVFALTTSKALYDTREGRNR